MDYIQRLPFIWAAIMTIAIGFVCYSSGEDTRDTYIKMLISMAVFYLLGMYVRKLIIEISKQVKEKKEQEELESLSKAQEAAKIKENAGEEAADGHNASEIDFKVDDSSDEFTPLKVSEVIKGSYLKKE